MSDDYLRREIKLLKALQGVEYKEIAEYLEVKACSFYAWIRGSYNFSTDRKNRLYEIIGFLKDND